MKSVKSECIIFYSWQSDNKVVKNFNLTNEFILIPSRKSGARQSVCGAVAVRQHPFDVGFPVAYFAAQLDVSALRCGGSESSGRLTFKRAGTPLSG